MTTDPHVRIELVDGSGGCYVTACPVKSLSAEDVAEAAGVAAAAFVRVYVRDRLEIGEWDPEAHLREWEQTNGKVPA